MEGLMPEHWGMGDAYSYIDDLGPKAAAWEFVRRNPEYRAVYTVYRFIIGGFATLFAQRWGCSVDPDLRADHAPIASLFTTELP
jgi:transcriptional regulator